MLKHLKSIPAGAGNLPPIAVYNPAVDLTASVDNGAEMWYLKGSASITERSTSKLPRRSSRRKSPSIARHLAARRPLSTSSAALDDV